MLVPKSLSFQLLLFVLLAATSLHAQTRPQETRPAPSPERQREIRDSIRNRRVVINSKPDSTDATDKTSFIYNRRPDRVLLAPRIERRASFRMGIPGWLLRMGLSMADEDTRNDPDYHATRRLLSKIKKIRFSVIVPNRFYDAADFAMSYRKWIRRKKAEPMIQVLSPGGDVQLHIKTNRKGKLKRIYLAATDKTNSNSVLMRVKTKIRPEDFERFIEALLNETEDKTGVQVDVGI